MSLLSKYIDGYQSIEESISGSPSIPRWLVKILLSLKVLMDLFGVLLILVVIVSVIGLVGKAIL